MNKINTIFVALIFSLTFIGCARDRTCYDCSDSKDSIRICDDDWEDLRAILIERENNQTLKDTLQNIELEDFIEIISTLSSIVPDSDNIDCTLR